MAGHSKWKQIKHKKAATDSRRSREFSKFARLIALESKKVGGRVDSPSLAAVIERAKAVNMPKDNIERAVAKGKAGEGADLENVRYETYGPGGVAVIIDGLTDSRNRTAQEIKFLLSDAGYALAAPGSAAWAFTEQKGELVPNMTVELTDEDAEKLGELVEQLESHDDVQSVYTNAE